MSGKKYKFGILGPGKIANRFAEALQTLPRAIVYAVASRDGDRARAFAEKFGVTKVHNTYQALAADPDVDVIYVATPHTFHHEHALLCLRNKKPVLCEKPLTLNKKLATEMVEAAKTNNTFLMEAMWTRFIPAVVEAKRWVDQNEIGPVQFVQGDFGFAAPYHPEGRVFNLQLGGGAQLDVGVYPMFLTLLILGKPTQIKAFANKAPTGADATTAALLQFPSGALAHIMSSVVSDSPKEAVILGTEGSITLHTPWHKAQALTLKKNDGTTTRKEVPYESNGLQFQAEEVIRCLDAGLTESPYMPWNMSLLMAEVSDEIQRQCGIVYPAFT
ncbi:MAG: Gfo/Idh/MocA family protein [Bacteroidota bacterium]